MGHEGHGKEGIGLYNRFFYNSFQIDFRKECAKRPPIPFQKKYQKVNLSATSPENIVRRRILTLPFYYPVF